MDGELTFETSLFLMNITQKGAVREHLLSMSVPLNSSRCLMLAIFSVDAEVYVM